MKTKPILAILLTISLLVMSCAPQNITVSTNPERNILSVNGEYQLEVNPDKAELSIAFLTNSSNAKDAQDQNRVLSNRVIDALKSQGIKAEDIESTEYDLHKMYDWNPKTGERMDRGYELRHSIKVTTMKLETVGNLVDLAISNGANNVDSISFGLTREMERQAKGEALAKAAQEATSKAQSVAANLGVQLGKVARASESANYAPYYPRYAMAGKAEMAMDAAPVPTMVSPQKLTISASVSLDYELK